MVTVFIQEFKYLYMYMYIILYYVQDYANYQNSLYSGNLRIFRKKLYSGIFPHISVPNRSCAQQLCTISGELILYFERNISRKIIPFNIPRPSGHSRTVPLIYHFKGSKQEFCIVSRGIGGIHSEKFIAKRLPVKCVKCPEDSGHIGIESCIRPWSILSYTETKFQDDRFGSSRETGGMESPPLGSYIVV